MGNFYTSNTDSWLERCYWSIEYTTNTKTQFPSYFSSKKHYSSQSPKWFTYRLAMSSDIKYVSFEPIHKAILIDH